MKQRIKQLLILVLMLSCIFVVSLKADSGWDGSYDSGGSDWGGSSWDSGSSSWDWDSDYSWSSSSGGSYSSSSGGSEIMGLIITMIMIFVIVYSIKNVTKMNGNTPIHPNSKYDNQVTPYDVNKIKEVLPDFDINEFRMQSFKIYKDIQIAWMDFDYDTLRKNTTDELFNLYNSDLKMLDIKKQKNIMKDFMIHDFEIIDMEVSDDIVSLKTRSRIECYDYVVDKNNKVVRGTDQRKVIYDYEMTFISGKTTESKCPACGAPLENVTSVVCPYCRTKLVSKSHDWVLSKKRVIYQRQK